MKKILFCIHKNSPFYHVIPRALSDLGYAVSVFDYYQSDLKVRDVGVLNNFITFDPQRTFINQEINRSLISRVKSKKPDYLFIIKGLHIENETIEEIKKQNVITINWFQDLLEFMPWLKKKKKKTRNISLYLAILVVCLIIAVVINVVIKLGSDLLEIPVKVNNKSLDRTALEKIRKSVETSIDPETLEKGHEFLKRKIDPDEIRKLKKEYKSAIDPADLKLLNDAVDSLRSSENPEP